MYIILVYDITLDNGGPKVLRNVFKTCKRYLTHIQNSVFEGEINRAKLEKLRGELGDYIRKDKDSVIVFKSRHQRWLNKDFWGIEDDSTSNFF
ncbi:CRISPR-associated endonuclease Cas2 [uncultured Ilyobacter sp.]|uniref:CRISPR-associated endonuclease Cas2 n=1 Tax=uncultured Ilyobacter sp. TaxID=544433 RepID=UPI0029F5BF2C|nr:CRISPR-associated endonuclease Cas2 [uncultured Ilyobacter sp.]